jgi:hypothetical protein
LSGYVQQEFTDVLKCGRLEYGFLRARCEVVSMRSWSLFPASEEAFAQAAAPGAWQKALPWKQELQPLGRGPPQLGLFDA